MALSAQDTTTQEPGWAFGVGGQVDEDSSESWLTTFNWAVAERTWLTFSGGRSHSPADRADVGADTLVAAVDHRFDTLGFALEMERWGDSAALETFDRRASLYIQKERFRIALEHEWRDIDIPFSVTGPLGRTIERTAEVDGDSTGLRVRVEPAERWQLYFGATEHDYERDLNVLPRIDSLNLLSTSTLMLAQSFVDHERLLGFEREIGATLLDVGVARDESAVDGSEFESLGAALLFPVARRVDLEITLGRGRSELLGSGMYGGVLLLLYGR
jgi:hypothetical protein